MVKNAIADPMEAASARSGGRSVQDYLARESKTHPTPDYLLTSSPGFFGTDTIPKERYVSSEWHQKEMDHLWTKVWQVACHEHEIPSVGDHTVYEIGKWSFLIVRSSEDKISAFYNACRHRGMKLKTERGNSAQLRCPNHGWTWDLSGELEDMPADWDFTHVDKKHCRLREVRVDTWGGFVFVCMDDSTPPLLEWIDPLPEHFAGAPLEDRQLVTHVSMLLPCNWKLAQEAFLEAYHVPFVHPQGATSSTCFDTQYDVFSDRVNRFISLANVPGDIVNYEMSEQDLLDALAEIGLTRDDGTPLEAGDRTARETMAEFWKNTLEAQTGADLSGLSISETIDGIQYQVFPNFLPWAGLSYPITYRFIPYRDDHTRCLFDIYAIYPTAKGTEVKPASATISLEAEKGDTFASVEALSYFGWAFDQDVALILRWQDGISTLPEEGIHMGAYQESRIRHYHEMLGRYINGDVDR